MRRKEANKKSIDPPYYRGARARSGGRRLKTCTIGALPIVNQLLDRMQLEQFLKQYLPPDRSADIPLSALGTAQHPLFA